MDILALPFISTYPYLVGILGNKITSARFLSVSESRTVILIEIELETYYLKIRIQLAITSSILLLTFQTR